MAIIGMDHPVNHLSGQRAKLFLLQMDLEGKNVLLLDEPSRNFFPSSQPQIRDVFTKFSGVIITVSHDRDFLKVICDQVYELTPTGFKLLSSI